MMFAGLKREIDQVAKDKGIDRKVIIEALEDALKQAARRKYGLEREIEAQYNDENEEIELFEFKTVVETITDQNTQITVAQARQIVIADERDHLLRRVRTEPGEQQERVSTGTRSIFPAAPVEVVSH